MTTNSLAQCSLGVTERNLSDFRSNGLNAQEMARLRAHVRVCHACQARLGEFDAMARMLRAQPEPNNHAQLWQSVRATIASTTTVSSSQRQTKSSRRVLSPQFLARIGAIAAVVALCVGFVALLVSHGGRSPIATQTATPVTVHSGDLTWKQVLLPHGMPDGEQTEGATTGSRIMIAPSDGKTAYACEGDRSKVSALTVWATHNAGASWSVITPHNLPSGANGCRLIVDESNANTIIASFYQIRQADQMPNPSQWVTYATFDGGATWSEPDGLQHGNVSYFQATAGDKIYSLRGIAAANGTVTIALYVSYDRMQSWKRIDQTLPLPDTRADGKAVTIHADSLTGELMVYTYDGALWVTNDAGAHWTHVRYPKNVWTTDPHRPGIWVGPPTTSAHLTVCGVFTPTQSVNVTQLACTTDNGATWKDRPSVLPGTVDVSPGTTAGSLGFIEVGADGGLYATGQGEDNVIYIFYLAPGGASWQRVGGIPDSKDGGEYVFGRSGAGVVIWTPPWYEQQGAKITVHGNVYAAIYP